MNKSRRAELTMIISKLESIRDDIEDIKQTEEEVYDNMPDSFRDGAKGDLVQEGVDGLDEALTSIEEVIESIQNVVDL